MTEFENLQAKLKSARLNRDSALVTILSTIVGDLASSAKMVDGVKVVSDDEVFSYLKKYVKNIEETIKLSGATQADPKWDIIFFELEYIKQFLPKLLTEQELRDILQSRDFINLGEFMKHLKTVYPNQFDGKVASKLWIL